MPITGGSNLLKDPLPSCTWTYKALHADLRVEPGGQPLAPTLATQQPHKPRSSDLSSVSPSLSKWSLTAIPTKDPKY